MELEALSLGLEETELEDSAGLDEGLELELDVVLEELFAEDEPLDGADEVVCEEASLGFALLELSVVL